MPNNDQPDAGSDGLQLVLNWVKQDVVMKLTPFIEELEQCGGLVLVDINEGGTNIAFKNLPGESCWRLQLAIRGL